MNLIEQLGGYLQAKALMALPAATYDCGVVFSREELESSLLSYRRQRNIFELEDLIVLLHTNYRSDVFALTKSFKEIYDEKGIVYRHATDEEIKAGRRL